VAEALELSCMRQLRLRAGGQGLGNWITGVNIIEVPEVSRWLNGGELLFTAFYAIRDSLPRQIELVGDLARKGVAALAVKPGKYLAAIPEEIIKAADSAGLPLLELPPDMPYMDVARPVLEMIMSFTAGARDRRSSRLGASLLEDLMLARPGGDNQVSAKARALGLDLDAQYVVVVIGPANGATAITDEAFELVRWAFSRMAGEKHVLIDSPDSRHLIGIVNCAGPDGDRVLERELSRVLEQLRGASRNQAMVIGISRMVRDGSIAFSAGYREALSAAEAPLQSGHGVRLFAGLGAYRLLKELERSQALLEFHQDVLGALVEYDNMHQGDLCKTAGAFIAAGGNLRKTAATLHVHRNTLLYRLKRIEEITGIDMKEPEDCLSLYLALKAHVLLERRQQGRAERLKTPRTRD
jgi:purine catabolism regulator